MQTDQMLEFHRPIKVGDRLTCDVYLDSFRQMCGSDIIVTKNIVTDQNDELVQTTYTTLVAGPVAEVDENIAHAVAEVVMHGVGADAPITFPRKNPTTTVKASLPDVADRGVKARAFDTVAVGDELPPKTVRLTRGDLVNYAGVSGDANPIHWSDEVVEAGGLDNVVAHGMLTMGLGARLRHLVARRSRRGQGVQRALHQPGLRRPATRPREVEFTGKVKSVDEETTTAVVAIVAKSAGKKIFGRATATVQLA